MQNSLPTPMPILSANEPVDWWFIFKFNAAEEPGTAKPKGETGIFDVEGWKRPKYEEKGNRYSQHFCFASSDNPALQHGKQILGTTKKDPLGATFAQTFLAPKPYFYVVWNDQFYGDPMKNGDSPWGHSKGMLVWNEDGEGYVLQVSTPSWPGAGHKSQPRKTDGNTLGFVSDDDIEVSQHFFCLKLNKDDVLNVLSGLHNSSVVTDPNNPQAVHNGGPAPIQTLVKHLGKKDKGTQPMRMELSSGVKLISKPSKLAVPPWQLVSEQLGGVDLRVACWWAYPKIYSTTKSNAVPKCWDNSLGKPGAVEIATTGTWKPDPKSGKPIESLGLEGGASANHNHAKFGVSTSAGSSYTIFGDMNQQGALCEGYLKKGQPCSSSQNGRGGLFYVMKDKKLFESVSSLLAGESAPTKIPKK